MRSFALAASVIAAAWADGGDKLETTAEGCQLDISKASAGKRCKTKETADAFATEVESCGADSKDTLETKDFDKLKEIGRKVKNTMKNEGKRTKWSSAKCETQVGKVKSLFDNMVKSSRGLDKALAKFMRFIKRFTTKFTKMKADVETVQAAVAKMDTDINGANQDYKDLVAASTTIKALVNAAKTETDSFATKLKEKIKTAMETAAADTKQADDNGGKKIAEWYTANKDNLKKLVDNMKVAIPNDADSAGLKELLATLESFMGVTDPDPAAILEAAAAFMKTLLTADVAALKAAWTAAKVAIPEAQKIVDDIGTAQKAGGALYKKVKRALAKKIKPFLVAYKQMKKDVKDIWAAPMKAIKDVTDEVKKHTGGRRLAATDAAKAMDTESTSATTTMTESQTLSTSEDAAATDVETDDTALETADTAQQKAIGEADTAVTTEAPVTTVSGATTTTGNGTTTTVSGAAPCGLVVALFAATLL